MGSATSAPSVVGLSHLTALGNESGIGIIATSSYLAMTKDHESCACHISCGEVCTRLLIQIGLLVVTRERLGCHMYNDVHTYAILMHLEHRGIAWQLRHTHDVVPNIFIRS